MRKNQFARLSLKASMLALCATGALIGASVQAAPADDAAARYRMERDNCMSGRTHQDRQTCLKEAGAAQGEARAGRLADQNAAYRQNALERCRVLPVSDREACVGRIDGSGRVSGSVEGGGVLREYTQRIQGTPADAAPMPMPVQPQRTYDGRQNGAVPYGGMPAPSVQPAPMRPAPVTR